MLSMAELPPLPDDHPWSPNIYHAYQIITDTFTNATNTLWEEADPIRIKYHIEMLTDDTIPILVALESRAQEERLPLPWLHSCVEIIGGLIVRLCHAYETADGL
jgi:hypothetical protein